MSFAKLESKHSKHLFAISNMNTFTCAIISTETVYNIFLNYIKKKTIINKLAKNTNFLKSTSCVVVKYVICSSIAQVFFFLD